MMERTRRIGAGRNNYRENDMQTKKDCISNQVSSISSTNVNKKRRERIRRFESALMETEKSLPEDVAFDVDFLVSKTVENVFSKGYSLETSRKILHESITEEKSKPGFNDGCEVGDFFFSESIIEEISKPGVDVCEQAFSEGHILNL